MRYGIISDIHGNYEAYKRVLNFFEREKVEKIINCGDIVGYGPLPNECICEVKNNPKIYSVLGNHDVAVSGIDDISRFNETAVKSINWSQMRIAADNIGYLKKLKYKRRENNFIFLHGSPRNPLYEYITEETGAKANFDKLDECICFVGHTHMPACFRKNPSGRVVSLGLDEEKPIDLISGCRYIINGGSVGQPRDGDSRACCLIYDAQKRQVKLHRIKYDIESVQALMRKQKLPGFLSRRLGRGI